MSKSRRQRRKRPVGGERDVFSHAHGAINTMEQAVCYRTVTQGCGFTVMDVIQWLWPPEVWQPLQAAFPVIKTGDRSQAQDTLILGHPDDPQVCFATFTFGLDARLAQVCAPAPGQIRLQNTPSARAIEGALRDIARIHEDYSVVREVVAWLDAHATLSAAKYYFPSIGALLPAGHPFHEATGTTYREPNADMTEIVPKMRVAMATIAAGLLCDPNSVQNDARAFYVNVLGTNGASSSNLYII